MYAYAKYEFSNKRDKATETELTTSSCTPAGSHHCEHTWKHQTGAVSLFRMLSANSLTAVTIDAIRFSGTDVSFGGKAARQWKKEPV